MDLTTLGLVIVSLIVMAIIIYVTPIVKKWAASKGINIKDTLITTDKIIELLQLIMKDSKILPADKQNFIDNIADILQKAIGIAQKMYENGECTKFERADRATELVFEMAKAANIPVTDAKKEIVIKVIQAMMLFLP